MPYAAGHRPEVRQKIVQSARRLFNRNGFDSVSNPAPATPPIHVAKVQLQHALRTLTDPEWKSCWEGVEVDLTSTDVGSQVVRAYLSRQHFEDVENSCPMVALPTDVSRSSESAKRAFENVFQAMVSVLERSSIRNGRPRNATARAIAALCVGGMVVARAMVNRAVADDLRDACMAVAFQLGGWDKQGKSRNKKSRRLRPLRVA